MMLLNSYSLKIVRCLLVAVLLITAQAVKAQTYDADTTAPVAAPVEETAADDEAPETDEAKKEKVEPWPASFRQVPDSTVKRLKALNDFEYANDSAYWTEIKLKEPETKRRMPNIPEPFFNFRGFGGLIRIVVIILFIGLLALLVYKMLGSRWPWQLKEVELKEEELTEEEILDPNSLEAKIREAVAGKKYRHAIRYSYLLTLRNLDAKGWIKYQSKSTNYDYVNQVRQFDPKGMFAYLTNIYDYVWYGEFELTEEQFSKVYKDFASFTNIPHH